MSMECNACGAAITGGALSCRRCGAEVPRSQDDRAAIHAERAVSAATEQIKQGSGTFGAILHISMLASMIPALNWIWLFPVGCALLMPDVPGRMHARACCWFWVDSIITLAVVVLVGLITLLALVAGSAVTGAVHGSDWGAAIQQGGEVGGGVFVLIIAVGYVVVLIRWIKHAFAAASAARDGGWHTYPVLFIAQRRTREHG
ncbi:MAG: hypothetical protein RLZ94_535 [Actinomycetota bacterium]|jgi:hypothetical protein